MAVGERLPNLQKCELSLFRATKLFYFAKEQVETIRTRLREELRPSYYVTIKTGRRRYNQKTFTPSSGGREGHGLLVLSD